MIFPPPQDRHTEPPLRIISSSERTKSTSPKALHWLHILFAQRQMCRAFEEQAYEENDAPPPPPPANPEEIPDYNKRCGLDSHNSVTE